MPSLICLNWEVFGNAFLDASVFVRNCLPWSEYFDLYLCTVGICWKCPLWSVLIGEWQETMPSLISAFALREGICWKCLPWSALIGEWLETMPSLICLPWSLPLCSRNDLCLCTAGISWKCFPWSVFLDLCLCTARIVWNCLPWSDLSLKLGVVGNNAFLDLSSLISVKEICKPHVKLSHAIHSNKK